MYQQYFDSLLSIVVEPSLVRGYNVHYLFTLRLNPLLLSKRDSSCVCVFLSVSPPQSSVAPSVARISKWTWALRAVETRMQRRFSGSGVTVGCWRSRRMMVKKVNLFCEYMFHFLITWLMIETHCFDPKCISKYAEYSIYFIVLYSHVNIDSILFLNIVIYILLD